MCVCVWGGGLLVYYHLELVRHIFTHVLFCSQTLLSPIVGKPNPVLMTMIRTQRSRIKAESDVILKV